VEFLAPVMAQRGGEAADPATAAQAASGASVEYLLMLLSLGIAVGGIWLAYRFYIQRPELPGKVAESSGFLYRLLYRKYYVDEIYDAMFVNRVKDLGLALGSFDRGVIDGVGVDGSGWLTRATSRVSIWWDTWIVDGLVNLAARVVWILSYPVRMLQGGRVSGYALWMVVGVLVFLGYYLWSAGPILQNLLH
jgi:NADH-quinone oxidoreductase subunit L